MIRKGLKPGFRLAIDRRSGDYHFRRVFPFRRSWVAIAVLAGFDAVFMFPAIATFNQALTEWGRFDSLFDLVGALFLSAWLLGWMVAPLLMTTGLILMLFGREVVKARPGAIEIFLGLPLVGVRTSYDPAGMRNLRLSRPPKKSGKGWRGPHLEFDYGANAIAFGSDIGTGEFADLRTQLQMATGTKIRRGDAQPDEFTPEWEKQEPARADPGLAESSVAGIPVALTSASTLLLIIANLIPIAGSVFLDWNLADVLVLYWAESAVIGFFNICKIIVIGRWEAVLAGPFFLGHFGGFMVIHFLFLYTLFIEPSQKSTGPEGDLADVARLFVVLWPALVALFASHGFSFYKNFLGRKEYLGRTVRSQMSEPYTRIIFMQFVLIFGGGLSMALGGPVLILLIVIALKIYFDVRAHLKQHANRQH